MKLGVTLPSAPPAEPAELDLLRSWREPVAPRRIARDVVGSLLVHVLIVLLLIFLPDTGGYQNAPEIFSDIHRATILYVPPTSELTQKAPNQGKVLKQLDSRSAFQAQPAETPHPRRVFTPPPGAPAPGPDALTIKGAQLQAPQLQAGLETPLPSLGATSGLTGVESIGAPPKPNATAQPKPAAPKPNPLKEALRAGGGGVTVGDVEDSPRVPGILPSPCDQCSALQLLSDPHNVDFKPYLLQVLAVVKQHWLAVIPASARAGRRGVVVLRFAIDRRGSVPQLEFTSPAGNDLNQAAVAGISESVPFPPFPAGFTGNEIRLQMAFAYNQVAH